VDIINGFQKRKEVNKDDNVPPQSKMAPPILVRQNGESK
jgi:hypothetical protein